MLCLENDQLYININTYIYIWARSFLFLFSRLFFPFLRLSLQNRGEICNDLFYHTEAQLRRLTEALAVEEKEMQEVLAAKENLGKLLIILNICAYETIVSVHIYSPHHLFMLFHFM